MRTRHREAVSESFFESHDQELPDGKFELIVRDVSHAESTDTDRSVAFHEPCTDIVLIHGLYFVDRGNNAEMRSEIAMNIQIAERFVHITRRDVGRQGSTSRDALQQCHKVTVINAEPMRKLNRPGPFAERDFWSMGGSCTQVLNPCTDSVRVSPILDGWPRRGWSSDKDPFKIVKESIRFAALSMSCSLR